MCAQSCLAFVGAVGPVESLDRAEKSVGRSCPRGSGGARAALLTPLTRSPSPKMTAGERRCP